MKNKVAIGIPVTGLTILFFTGAPVWVLVGLPFGVLIMRYKLHSIEGNNHSFLRSLRNDLAEMRGGKRINK